MENEKNKKINILSIIFAILSLIMLLISIFNITFVKNEFINDATKNTFIMFDKVSYNKKINKANITDLTNDFTTPYYPQITFSLDSTSFVRLIDYNKGVPWVFINDNETYIYHEYNTSTREINFKLTNGIDNYYIAKYSFVLNGSTYVISLVDSSDGYLGCFRGDSYNFVKFFNTFTITSLKIFSQNRPDYVGNGINTQVYEYIVGNNNVDDYYQNGYNEGYDNGYQNGIDYVLDNPNENNLYTSGEYEYNYDNGYEIGYNAGVEYATNNELVNNGFKTLFGAILNSPFNILYGFLNFELFGVNLFNLLAFIFSVTLAFFIVKLVFLRR